MEIITLLKANIKHKKSNFITILLLMIIISTVLTSVISTEDNISNRWNDFKAYGFKSLSIRLQFCIRHIIVAVFSSIIGAVLFAFFGYGFNETTLVTLGITKFNAPITLTSLLIPPAIVMVFVFIAAFVTLRKVKSVDTKELIVE